MEKIDINQSVDTLDFGSKHGLRIQQVCRGFNIKTIRDLCKWPGRDLVRLRGIGGKSIDEIEDVLKKYNLRLGMFNEELDKYAGIGNTTPEDKDEEAKWEQRRYEIAKEMFVRNRLVANSAVIEADALIRVLRGMTRL